MLDLVKILAYIGQGVAGILLGTTFTSLDRMRFRWISRLDGKRLVLLGICVTCLLANVALDTAEKHIERAQLAKEFTSLKSVIEALKTRVPGLSAPTETVGSSAGLARATLEAAVSISLAAEEQYTRGNLSDALSLFLQADRLAMLAPIKARIADTYFQLGRYDMTIAYEERAFQLAPDWSGPPYMLALSHQRLGQLEKARSYAQQSCNLGFKPACDLLRDLR